MFSKQQVYKVLPALVVFGLVAYGLSAALKKRQGAAGLLGRAAASPVMPEIALHPDNKIKRMA